MVAEEASGKSKQHPQGSRHHIIKGTLSIPAEMHKEYIRNKISSYGWPQMSILVLSYVAETIPDIIYRQQQDFSLYMSCTYRGGNATFDNNEQSSKIADHSIERKHIYNIQTETTL